jgi:hypothetical protein
LTGTGFGKSAVETHAERGCDSIRKIDETGAIRAADGDVILGCKSLQLLLQARAFAAHFGESGADDRRRLYPFDTALLQSLRNGACRQSNHRQVHFSRDIG